MTTSSANSKHKSNVYSDGCQANISRKTISSSTSLTSLDVDTFSSICQYLTIKDLMHLQSANTKIAFIVSSTPQTIITLNYEEAAEYFRNHHFQRIFLEKNIYRLGAVKAFYWNVRTNSHVTKQMIPFINKSEHLTLSQVDWYVRGLPTCYKFMNLKSLHLSHYTLGVHYMLDLMSKHSCLEELTLTYLYTRLTTSDIASTECKSVLEKIESIPLTSLTFNGLIGTIDENYEPNKQSVLYRTLRKYKYNSCYPQIKALARMSETIFSHCDLNTMDYQNLASWDHDVHSHYFRNLFCNTVCNIFIVSKDGP